MGARCGGCGERQRRDWKRVQALLFNAENTKDEKNGDWRQGLAWARGAEDAENTKGESTENNGL